MSHTPGPWTIDKAWYSAVNGNGGKKHVAMVNFYKCPDKDAQVDEAEHEANARLIAAAPELLEACINLVNAMVRYQMDVEGEPTTEHRNMMYDARAAIAKAKGE